MAENRRALVVADSDSYLKWAVTRMRDLGDGWESELVVVRNAVTPSPSQMRAAIGGRLESPPAVVGFGALAERLRDDPPDLLLLACRGDLIELLLAGALKGRRAAAVVAAGIPGIWYPPSPLGVSLRAAVDVLIVHSRRERDAVLPLRTGRISQVALASLLHGQDVSAGDRPRVVFAPQAIVPSSREDRVRLLGALVETAQLHPEVDVVIKLRGDAGEAQTHAEFASFPALAENIAIPANLHFAQGPLSNYLGGCVGFVTVSSTAALEAIDAEVPCLILTDFGVSADAINLVFDGSGLLGTLEDLTRLDFKRPDDAWLEDNYFHAEDDWVRLVEARLEQPETDDIYRDPRAGLRGIQGRIRRRVIALGAEDPSPLGAIARVRDAWRRARS